MPAIDDSIAQVLADLQHQKLRIVNSRRKNGLIIYKQHYAEFAGPGAAIGSIFDQDVTAIYPVGNWSLLNPQDANERERAYRMRRQWIKLFHQMTQHPIPIERVQMLLNHLETWFDASTVAKIPDETIARLVGVLPSTVSEIHRTSDW
ncbi:MAG: hypothetical protein F6J87_00640 [Spirulina sp. SIO3F2]|nr:hypothetical protein [Spirulina sp. SIO3F2]